MRRSSTCAIALSCPALWTRIRIRCLPACANRAKRCWIPCERRAKRWNGFRLNLIERIDLLPGQRRKYAHEAKGYTSRLDSIQALFLLHKLPHLDRWNAERVETASFYTERLAGVGDLGLPANVPNSSPVWHLYVVRTADPAALAAFLRDRGIGTSRHYPEAVHLAGAYRELGYARGAFPIAERLAQEVLSLPIFPGITDEQLEAVGDAIEEFFRRG